MLAALIWTALAVGILTVVGAVLWWVLVGRRRVPSSPRRKTALSLWRGPSDAYIHTKALLDAEAALAYLERLRSESRRMATITHLVGKAVARALVEVPELNRTLVGNTFVGHEGTEISFLIALEGGNDTDWVKLQGVESMPVPELARALTRAAMRARRGDRRGGALVRLAPVVLLRPLLRLAGWLASGLGLSLRPFGVERYPFGRAVVIDSAAFGAEEVYVARTSFARVPLNLVICRVAERPMVVDGQVVARRCFNLCVNADHRYVDGLHLSQALKIVRDLVEHPERLDETPRTNEPLDHPERRDEAPSTDASAGRSR